MNEQHDPHTGELIERPATPPATHSDDIPLAPQNPFSGPHDKIDKVVTTITATAARVAKGGTNTFQNYKYPRIEDYTDVVAPLLGEHGLAIYETAIGRNEISGMVYVDYHFYMSAEGQTAGPFKVTGQARSRDSKGNFDPASLAKCLTSARKQFYAARFHLKTGDDPDRDGPARSASANARTPIAQPASAVADLQIDAQKPKVLGRVGDEPGENSSRRFLSVIGKAATLDRVEMWLDLNKAVFEAMRKELPDHHAHIMRQYQKRVLALQQGEPA